MKSRITAGIDIGTSQIKVVVAEEVPGSDLPKIIGAGSAESKGLRHGYIINSADVIKSLQIAVAAAEKASGFNIRRAFISVGGIGLGSAISSAQTVVARGDQNITEMDVENALKLAEEAIAPSLIQNRKIIYTIPLQWKVDGKPTLGRIVATKGVRIEVKALFVSCIETHLNDLIEAVEEAGIDVIDVVASPIAASFVTLSKPQKIVGCVLANIGAETVSIVVFENNLPISLEVFQVGGANITNDIALGLRIALEEAEAIKMGSVTGTTYPKKKLDEIINARLSDIFELVENHLKKIGKSGSLPAGIIITGGSSAINNIEEVARHALRLPTRLASIRTGDGKVTIKDSSWSVSYGLCIMGSLPEEEERMGLHSHGGNIIAKLTSWIKQFLP